MSFHTTLSEKYNVPVPRYTSYPTVPAWQETHRSDRWVQRFSEHYNSKDSCIHPEGLSLYIHLPFCESLCIYCGCTKKITRDRSVGNRYIEAVLAEWAIYRELLGKPPLIREIHLGGGTPTFFSPANLRRLIEGILRKARLHPQYSSSLEGHPNNTTREHLDTLYELGFRRVSFGIQDTDPEVQRLIHRVQPFLHVERAMDNARRAGYSSVNMDLVYGLPAQDAGRLLHSVDQCLGLRPDRVAFYSYAHIPEINFSQRLIDERLLPGASGKLALYQLGRQRFLENGYTDIGMDHFSLPSDGLFQAWKAGNLHRNFMGYTVQKTRALLGLGLSAISDGQYGYVQNSKSLTDYYRSVEAGELAIRKEYFLTEEDKVFRRNILELACAGSTVLNPEWSAVLGEWTLPKLREFEQEGLVTIENDNRITLTAIGRLFLRHVCKSFDLHLLRKEKMMQEKALLENR